jgi:hypothetical protein
MPPLIANWPLSVYVPVAMDKLVAEIVDPVVDVIVLLLVAVKAPESVSVDPNATVEPVTDMPAAATAAVVVKVLPLDKVAAPLTLTGVFAVNATAFIANVLVPESVPVPASVVLVLILIAPLTARPTPFNVSVVPRPFIVNVLQAPAVVLMVGLFKTPESVITTSSEFVGTCDKDQLVEVFQLEETPSQLFVAAFAFSAFIITPKNAIQKSNFVFK